MNFTKYLAVFALAFALISCGLGSHGYEGEYEASVFGIKKKMIIGSDYLEVDGGRQIFDEVFVRETGNEKYLIFKLKNEESPLKIIDDKTLSLGGVMTYHRVE